MRVHKHERVEQGSFVFKDAIKRLKVPAKHTQTCAYVLV